MSSFRYIKVSLVLVLGFVGVKMLLTHHLPIGSGISLGVIVSLLGLGVLASIVQKPKPESLPDQTAVPPSGVTASGVTPSNVTASKVTSERTPKTLR
jgi:hypothetical protein